MKCWNVLNVMIHSWRLWNNISSIKGQNPPLKATCPVLRQMCSIRNAPRAVGFFAFWKELHQMNHSLHLTVIVLQVWAETCSLELLEHHSVQKHSLLRATEAWETKGTLSWFCFPEPAALICEKDKRKWATARIINSLTHSTINTSVKPHCGIWLILTHRSLSNLFFLQDYLYLTFIAARSDTGGCCEKRVFNLSPTDLSS